MRSLQVAEDVQPHDELDRNGYEANVLAAIEQGLADAEAGRVVDDEDLYAALVARIGALAG